MKSKKIFIFIFFAVLALSFFSMSEVSAGRFTGDLKFKPNVSIPGSKFSEEIIITNEGNLLGDYIVALYKYGASLAGIIAVFMLVLAGWKWLMAAGNAQKITSAKEMINGVLIGLALLFGGQLLLSQISKGLVQFQPIVLTSLVTIEEDEDQCRSLVDNYISLYQAAVEDASDTPGPSFIPAVPTLCGEFAFATTSAVFKGRQINCIGSWCDGDDASTCLTDDNKPCSSISSETNCHCSNAACERINFPPLHGSRTLKDCGAYDDRQMCENNTCFNREYRFSSGSRLNEICYWRTDKCLNLANKRCSSSADCEINNNPDSRNWCCKDASFGGIDVCRPIGGEGGINESACKP